MKLQDLTDYLDEFLNTDNVKDGSQNGLQVEGSGDVSKVAFAVDACQASFDQAIAQKADLLIVHHGLFWGQSLLLTGTHFKRIQTLLNAGLGLYASHLPLDMHPEVGNNAELVRLLGLKNMVPFGEYKGMTIGFSGAFDEALPLKNLVERLAEVTGQPVLRVDEHGPPQVSRVACISGFGVDDVVQAAKAGFDTYITGETSHTAAHLARELGVNVIYGGHWATETVGLKALALHIENKFSLETFFIDLPTEL